MAIHLPGQAEARRLAALATKLINTSGNVDDAIALCQGAVALDPKCGDAWNALSAAFNQYPGNEEQQAGCAALASKLMPDDPTPHHNYSLALMRMNQWERAFQQSKRALELSPDRNPYFPMQAAFLCSLLGRHADALDYLDLTLARLTVDGKPHPQAAEFRGEVNIARAIAFAKLGDWAGFLNALDSRHSLTPAATTLGELYSRGRLWTQYKTPRDEPAEALVYLEWGIGDQIQFSRLVPMSLRRFYRHFRRVTVACSPSLISLMRTLPGVDKVISHADVDPDKLPRNVAVIPAIDLMRDLFTAGEFPLGSFLGPYLHVPREVSARMRRGFHQDAGKIAVGFTWQGDPRQVQDFTRAIPFKHISAWCSANRDKYTFHMLQSMFAGHCEPWEGWPPDVPFDDCSGLMDHSDLATVAGLIQQCDVFVGQCGGLIHLAGAIGTPAVAMLGKAHDWRWDFEPLYGGLKFAVQERPGDWPSAFRQLERAIVEHESRRQNQAVGTISEREAVNTYGK